MHLRIVAPGPASSEGVQILMALLLLGAGGLLLAGRAPQRRPTGHRGP